MRKLLCLLLWSFLLVQAHGDDLDASLEAEKEAQTATAITIIFDTSGSMDDDNKMEEAKRAFSTWIGGLEDGYSLGLIDFASGKGRLMVPISQGVKDAIAQHVSVAKPYGKTPIVQCLQIAGEEIAKRRAEHSPYERHVVVVFTDGYETVDPTGTRGVLKEVLALRRQVIEVVGIGFHGQGAYMNPAVTRYFEADNEEELVASLREVDAEIGDDTDLEISESDLIAMEALEVVLPDPPGGIEAKQ